MDITHRAAIKIMDWLHAAERDIVGEAIVTFNGEAGVVRAFRLDELHGLCFTIDEPVSAFDSVEGGKARRWYPVSTIKQRA